MSWKCSKFKCGKCNVMNPIWETRNCLQTQSRVECCAQRQPNLVPQYNVYSMTCITCMAQGLISISAPIIQAVHGARQHAPRVAGNDVLNIAAPALCISTYLHIYISLYLPIYISTGCSKNWDCCWWLVSTNLPLSGCSAPHRVWPGSSSTGAPPHYQPGVRCQARNLCR